jgi:hypothetical protein
LNVLISVFIKQLDTLEKSEFTVSHTEKSITINGNIFWRSWPVLIVLTTYTMLPIFFIYAQEHGLTAIFFIPLSSILLRFLMPLFFKLSISPRQFSVTDLVISYEKIHMDAVVIPRKEMVEYKIGDTRASIHILTIMSDGKKHKLLCSNRNFQDAVIIFENLKKELSTILLKAIY